MAIRRFGVAEDVAHDAWLARERQQPIASSADRRREERKAGANVAMALQRVEGH